MIEHEGFITKILPSVSAFLAVTAIVACNEIHIVTQQSTMTEADNVSTTQQKIEADNINSTQQKSKYTSVKDIRGSEEANKKDNIHNNTKWESSIKNSPEQ